jgi:hypothetical protein
MVLAEESNLMKFDMPLSPAADLEMECDHAEADPGTVVRTEDIGYTLTEDIGYTLDWADALEKSVNNGTETTICEFGRDEPFYGDRALPGV